MRWIKVLLASAIALMAIAAFSASGASAAPSVFLKGGGKVLSKGAPVDLEYLVGISGAFCEQTQEGKVKSNGKPKDQASLTSTIKSAGCEGVASTGGSLKQVEVTNRGKFIVDGKLTIKVSSSCTYEVKKFESEVTFPGVLGIFGEGVGKLAKGSSKSCAKTQLILLEAGLDDMETEELIEAET